MIDFFWVRDITAPMNLGLCQPAFAVTLRQPVMLVQTPFVLPFPFTETLAFLCSCFRESQVYIYKCPTRCNNMRSIFYFMFRVQSAPIIRST